MPEEPPLPNYLAYSGEDEATGARFVVLYPGDEEADDDRKAQLRAMVQRMIDDLPDERPQPGPGPAETARPALRLVRGDGS
ncbi:hypothetical protein ABT093_26120 [Kitasatospora sp. NPDC002551]|uniref:hypothetical protein n=1 Tax=unclassified Kitasatospora TaxID=2633591 RepID=UPI00331C23A5